MKVKMGYFGIADLSGRTLAITTGCPTGAGCDAHTAAEIVRRINAFDKLMQAAKAAKAVIESLDATTDPLAANAKLVLPLLAEVMRDVTP